MCERIRSDEPKLAPVSGTLTLDGKPLPHKFIRFVPEPGTPGLGGGRNCEADGTYTLLAQLAGKTEDFVGVLPGQYRVVVKGAVTRSIIFLVFAMHPT